MSSWPAGSNRRARGARDSGTNRAVSTIAASTTGTLIQKIDRQPTVSTSSAAEHRAQRHADADDAAPHADGPGPLRAVGEDVA